MAIQTWVGLPVSGLLIKLITMVTEEKVVVSPLLFSLTIPLMDLKA